MPEVGTSASISLFGVNISAGLSLESGVSVGGSFTNKNNTSGFEMSFRPGGYTLGGVVIMFVPEAIPALAPLLKR